MLTFIFLTILIRNYTYNVVSLPPHCYVQYILQSSAWKNGKKLIKLQSYFGAVMAAKLVIENLRAVFWSYCMSKLYIFTTGFAFTVGKDKEVIHKTELLSHHQQPQMSVFYFHPVNVLWLCYEGLSHFFFSNLLYFVYDLFLSIAYRFSMRSTLGVITSHPVSSPRLHLSFLHLFSMWFSFFPLISCVHMKSLLSTCLSVSLFVSLFTHKHTYKHSGIANPHYFFVIIFNIISLCWFLLLVAESPIPICLFSWPR